MARAGSFILACLASLLSLHQPASAERLNLAFLPPDLPPSNVCNAEPEVREEGEIEDGEVEFTDLSGDALELEEMLRFLDRDIRDLTADGADEWTDYIEALITWKTEIDPDFTPADETLARVDLLIKGGKLSTVKERGLLTSLAARTDTLSNAQKVELARYLRVGVGIERDRTAADRLLVEAGFAGASNALFTILRLQVAGDPVDGWDVDIEETATLAFGGLIGQINRGLCGRAERMARAYIEGDILVPNMDLAYAWRVFAADMGGARAAWRVVEHHLNGTAPRTDHDALERYLKLAVENGFAVGAKEASELVDGGALSEREARALLRRMPSVAQSASRRSATQFLALQVNPLEAGISSESDLRRYLNKALEITGAPGVMYTRLAKEVLLRDGQWAGRQEAEDLLTAAVALGDPDAMVLLAEIKASTERTTTRLNEAEELLLEAVSGHAHVPAMNELDELYRCRMPQAPMLSEATFWANAYRATGAAPTSISATDVTRVDPTLAPEVVGSIQSLAVRGHAASTANLLQMLQSDPLVSDETLRYWASRVSSSDNALEDYVIQEFTIALDQQSSERAIALMRRAYLDIGPSISLDLAVALVEHAGRDPEVAQDVRGLLERAASRGEGAAMRLLQRLEKDDAAEAYEKYAGVIAARGDFLAIMMAAPFLDETDFHLYMARAIALMNCGTKDAAELADAYVLRGLNDEAAHWLRVGLALDGGHSLSKFGLSDVQREAFGTGLTAKLQGGRENDDALRRAYLELSDPRLRSFDVAGAAGALVSLLESPDPERRAWALGRFRAADPRIMEALLATLDINQVFETEAKAGNPEAQYDWAMYLRNTAELPEDLKASGEWLLASAQAGNAEAMAEYGFALGFGVGVERDTKLALIWLQKAQSLGSARARELAQMLRSMDPD